MAHPKYWPKARIIRALRDYYAAHGEAPTSRQCQATATRPEGMPCTLTVANTFGSWGNALAAAGLSPKKAGVPARNDGRCVYGHIQTSGSCVECHRARRRRIGQRERMLTPEVDRRAAEAIGMVREGWTARAAAKQVGISKQALLRRLHRDHPELDAPRRTISHLEDRVAAQLDALGIEYKRQEPIETELSYCSLDFLIGDLALEVNGTYWHCDPRAFPQGPRYPAQRRGQENWISKQAAIAKAGLSLAVVWEIDLDRDMAGTLTAVLRGRVPVGA